MNETELSSDKVLETIEQLEKRIGDRFPSSGLLKLCIDFLDVARKSSSNIVWISKPNWTMRIVAALIILIGLGGLVYSIRYIDLQLENTTLENVVSLSEAVFNDLLLVGAAIFFIVSFESKHKRKRALKALHQLRVVAHVIDMHQLTKDPSTLSTTNQSTKNSPKRRLTRYELARYLDYCSEMTALVSKVAVLYAQSLPDDVIVKTVNEIETLCTGLSQKIWQKLVFLKNSNGLTKAG